MLHQSITRLGVMALAIAALAVTPVFADGHEATDVIGKHVEAIGGVDAVKSIESLKTTGTFSIVDMGLVLPNETYMAGGNFYSYTDVSAMGGNVLQGIKDGVVWESHFMNGDNILEGEQAAAVIRQSKVDALAYHDEWVKSAEITGEGDVDGEAATIVEITPNEGATSTYYFSKDSGLLLQIDGIGPDGMPTTTKLSEYKEVGGVKMPHQVNIQGMMSISITRDSVEANVDIPAEQFDYPESISNLLNPPAEEATEEAAEGSEGSEGSAEGSDDK